MQWDSATIQAVSVCMRWQCCGHCAGSAGNDTSIRLLCDGVCWWYI